MTLAPAAQAALDVWFRAHAELSAAATVAFRAALPVLSGTAVAARCGHSQIVWRRGALVAGTVCMDEDHRTWVTLSDLPLSVIGPTVDAVWTPGLFDEAPDGIAAAAPGTYTWVSDASLSDVEIQVADGTATVAYSNAWVPEAIELLDALHTAMTARGTNALGLGWSCEQ